jgi:hypothetical protein
MQMEASHPISTPQHTRGKRIRKAIFESVFIPGIEHTRGKRIRKAILESVFPPGIEHIRGKRIRKAIFESVFIPGIEHRKFRGNFFFKKISRNFPQMGIPK